jgi:hypothetical protein
VEVIFLSIWTLVDPLDRVEEIFPPEVPENTDEDVRIRPLLEHCESKHNNIWLGKLHLLYLLLKVVSDEFSLRGGMQLSTLILYILSCWLMKFDLQVIQVPLGQLIRC